MGVWDEDPYTAIDRHDLANRKLKRTLYVMNSIIWVLGLLLVIIGAYTLLALKDVSELLPMGSLPAGLVVIGVFILLLTVVGCCTTKRGMVGGLVLYTIFMLLLLICLLGVGGGTFAYRHDVVDKLGDSWDGASDDARNMAQEYFSCCGWNETQSYPGSNCLVNGTSNHTEIDVGNEVPDPSKPPCKTRIVEFADKYLYIAAVAGVVISIIQFVAMAASLYLVIWTCRNPYKNFDRDGL